MKRFAAILLSLMMLCSFAAAETVQMPLCPMRSGGAACPAAETTPEKTTIVTVGSADATAPIDIAVLSFSVVAEGETVAEANKLVTASIDAITSVFKEHGVEDDQIWHKSYDVSPDVVHHNTKLTDAAVIDGYIVEIVLCVRLTDISLVGVVIDGATQKGASATHELKFERSTAFEVYEKALNKAAKQAMNKAAVMADGCGMELDRLVSVKELSSAEDGEARVEVTYTTK